MCLRMSRQPRFSSPKNSTRYAGVPTQRLGHLAEAWVVSRAGAPANAAARSANSHGRPRQPRPTTTPSQPVSSTMRRASSADQMSPLPRTGSSVTVSLSSRMAAQSAVPE